MPDQELAFTSASDLRDLIDSKQVSIVELTELYLRRIEALNPALNAYLTVTAEEALTSARAAQEALARGDVRGPLHGIPISIKDLEATKGVRSTMGSRIFEDHVPDQDSVVVGEGRLAIQPHPMVKQLHPETGREAVEHIVELLLTFDPVARYDSVLSWY